MNPCLRDSIDLIEKNVVYGGKVRTSIIRQMNLIRNSITQFVWDAPLASLD